MKALKQNDPRGGSVVMVALCFMVVLGIVLASYLAVSNQAMKLSNRSYLKSVSKQLAEMGLEQALWAYNRHNWDPSDWSFTGTTIKTAVHSIPTTIPSSLYGNGVSGTVNVRVENYDAPTRAVDWKSGQTYNLNDVVCYSRISLWNSGASYLGKDVVADSSGARYSCILPHTSQPLTNTVYWKLLTTTDFSDFRRWYICISRTNQPPPDSIKWTPYTPTIFSEGVAAPPFSAGEPIKTQIRGIVSTSPLFPNAVGVTSALIFNAASTIDSYDSVSDPTALTRGYSATLASTGTTFPAIRMDSSATIQGYIAAPSSPTNPSLVQYNNTTSLRNGPVVSPHPTAPNVDLTRVSRSPYVPQFAPAIWYGSTGFEKNDVVRYPQTNGSLYRCIIKPLNEEPPTNATYWEAATIVTKPDLMSPIGDPDTTSPGHPQLEIFTCASDLALNSGETITVQGPVILDIQGSLQIHGTGSIDIKTTGSAEIYFQKSLQVGTFSGPMAAAAGFTHENPGTKDPKKLILVGIDSNDGVAPFFGPSKYWSTSPFYGVIYTRNCPRLYIMSEVYGAVSAKSVTFPNSTDLHYDTSLRTKIYHSIDFLYVITEWRELTDPAEQITFP